MDCTGHEVLSHELGVLHLPYMGTVPGVLYWGQSPKCFPGVFQGFVDCFCPSTILVEMKSKGKDLAAAFGRAMD